MAFRALSLTRIPLRWYGTSVKDAHEEWTEDVEGDEIRKGKVASTCLSTIVRPRFTRDFGSVDAPHHDLLPCLSCGWPETGEDQPLDASVVVSIFDPARPYLKRTMTAWGNVWKLLFRWMGPGLLSSKAILPNTCRNYFKRFKIWNKSLQSLCKWEGLPAYQ